MSKNNSKKSAAVDLRRVANLTGSEVSEVVEVCVAAPMDGYPGKDGCLWGMPALIEGEPGLGKTARVKQLANVLVVKAKSLFAAQHPPEDFSGALIPDGEGGARQICPLAQVRALIKEGKGIIFLDEINGAPPATQGALQSFIHERVAGDEEIPGRIRIIAAANPADIATGGFALSAPLANRFVHIMDPGPNAREWSTWLMGSSKTTFQADLNTIEQSIISDWPDVYPETQGLFAGFMEQHGDAVLHKRPDPSDPNSSRAWPSPRTWDYATRVWATSRILEKNDSIRDALIEACVGEGATTIFLEYQRNARIPKPMEVLQGKWKPNTDRLDIVLAAYTSTIAYVRQRPTREDQIKLAPLAWDAINLLFEAGLSDIAVPSAEGLIQERLARNSGDEATKKAATKVLVYLSKTGAAKFIEERP